MGLKTGKVRTAVVQAAPAIMDKKETMKIVRKLALEAAGQGAKIILFPEAFIPCYPRGLTFGTVVGNGAPRAARTSPGTTKIPLTCRGSRRRNWARLPQSAARTSPSG